MQPQFDLTPVEPGGERGAPPPGAPAPPPVALAGPPLTESPTDDDTEEHPDDGAMIVASKNRTLSSARPENRLVVFNRTRQSFLSLGVTPADTHLSRLIGLLGRRRLHADEGLWVVPCQGIHTIGVFCPIDVIYLDEDNRVVHLLENFGPFRVGPVRMDCHSVLELPVRTIYSSYTQINDQLLICADREIETLLDGDPTGEAKAHLDPTELERISKWLARQAPKRHKPRRKSAPVVAYYWNGGKTVERPVRNVSMSGAFILTPDRWYPGTVVAMTFQYDREAIQGLTIAGDPGASVYARGKVVRHGPDGIGVKFLFLTPDERQAFERFLDGAQVRE